MDAFEGSDATAIARLIFHEFMHNKLQMGNDMHFDADVGFGLASDQIDFGTGLGHRSAGITFRNARAMAQALFNKAPQYKGQ